MKNWTFDELKGAVERSLDLQQDTIITDVEMLEYCNEGIDTAEAEIHKLGVEDLYFLTYANLNLVQGEDMYSPPSDLYGNKLIEIIYNDGSRVYEIKRLRGRQKFSDLARISNSGPTDDYAYMLVNRTQPVDGDATTGRKILLIPASRETDVSGKVRIWYIRNAGRMTAGTDILDIPEFADFITQFMKVRCMSKEQHPGLAAEIAILQDKRKLMIDTLTEMVPDGDNEIEPDTSHYQDHN